MVVLRLELRDSGAKCVDLCTEPAVLIDDILHMVCRIGEVLRVHVVDGRDCGVGWCGRKCFM